MTDQDNTISDKPDVYRVAAFYYFAPLERVPKLQEALREQLTALHISGTVLLAPEGVNGTIAGRPEVMDAAMDAIRALPGCEAIEAKFADAYGKPFEKLKVKSKKEIITFKEPKADPNVQVGEYVSPADWNAVLQDPDTVVIDTRNDFEVAAGTFEGAIDPKTVRFSDFPDWFRKFHAEKPARKYAMFCTGGIRCEKASSLLKAEGIEDVVHLKGGILKYLETVPEDESLWNGDCFVFDYRVSVGHGLVPAADGKDTHEWRNRPRPPKREE